MPDESTQSTDDFILISDGGSSESSRCPVSPPANVAMDADIQSNDENNPHPQPHAPVESLQLFEACSRHPPHHRGPSGRWGPPPHRAPHGPPRHGGAPLFGPPRHGGASLFGPPRHGGPPLFGAPPGPPRHGGLNMDPLLPDEEHHPPPFHHDHHPRHQRGHGDCDHPSNPSTAYMNNSSAPYSNTTLFLHKIVAESHPKAGIMVTDDWNIDLLRFAGYPENGAKVTPNSTEFPGSPFVQYAYMPPSHRIVGEDNFGSLGINGVSWGKFDYEYNNEPFILYITQWSDRFSSAKLQFLVHEPKKSSETAVSSKKLAKDLLLRASSWEEELHNEVWIFDQGFWRKDAALWDSMQQASWDDVIMPPDLKSAIRGDIQSFFKNKSTYDDIGIAWKRGIILHGPPGNGKTISLKATMKDLYYSLEVSPIPTLYVRSLQAWGGNENALRMIFEKARSVAPCMLVLEDLDSLITPGTRSYFLNQMDGLDDNNGILVVGTTNHIMSLDPGIVARPSRFDRKYEFGLPGTGEGGRPTYVEYWRKKLENRPGIQFPESLVAQIVDMTEGFSFAYMKEAFVSTLLLIAARQDSGEGGTEGFFGRVIIEQLKNLKGQLG